jgi:iron complex outermembrane receptor protein
MEHVSGERLSVSRAVRRALMLSLASALAVGGTHAQAQTVAATDTDEGLQEVIVTGSYIPRIDKETPSPVTVISAEQIARSGLTTTADVVRTLSADNSGTLPTAFPGAFAAGASGVALRGLTVNSTLVLIDGNRAAAYALPDDGVRSFVDLNSIPIDTIERIEVLKDGASSIYGADAIGGVVNVILKKSYQGISADAGVGISQHGGGFEKRASIIAGTGDLASDRFNFYVSAEYQSDAAIAVGEGRGFPYNTADLSSIGGLNLNPQPSVYPFGTTFGSVTPGTLGTPGNILTGIPLNGAVSQPLRACPASNPQSTDAAGNVYCAQDRNLAYDDQPPTERVGLSTRFTVQINDETTAYLNASYYQNQDTIYEPPAQIQSSVPTNTDSIALPPTLPTGALNPNNPFAAAGQYAIINYAFGDLGGQDNYLKNHNLRLVGDLAGKFELGGNWNYDASFVINHTWLDNILTGYVNYTALTSAVINGTYNFVNPAANSGAVRSALAPTVETNDTSDLDSVAFRVNRTLFDLPGGPLGVALGTEWRYEAEYDPDLNASLQLQGDGVSQAIGSRNVSAEYVELGAPVLKSLEVDASGRYDHYSDFGGAFTPKFGVKFKPIDMLALRGTYSRGFRAPSFAENGSSEVEGFVNYTPPPGSLLATSHNGDGYVQQYSLGEFTTANPKIQPEKSWSDTLGFVFEPIKNFTFTADYYFIKKTNLIAPLTPTAALVAYSSTGTQIPGYGYTFDVPDPAAPGGLLRPTVIASPYVNSATEYTDGYDLDFLWAQDFGPAGRFSSELQTTDVMSFVYEPVGQARQQYSGTEGPYNLSSGAGTPKWRGNWNNTYSWGPATASAIVYYTSGFYQFGEDVAPPGVCLYGPPTLPTNCHIGSFTDVDLTGSYTISKQWTVSAAVQNVLDRLPPLNPANYAGINYNPTYAQAGIVGRFFRVSARFTL